MTYSAWWGSGGARVTDAEDGMGRPQTVTAVLTNLGAIGDLMDLVRGLAQQVRTFQLAVAGMEERHERLAHLGKVRAETRLKNAAAEQLEVFDLFMTRLDVVLMEMPPRTFTRPCRCASSGSSWTCRSALAPGPLARTVPARE